MLEQLIDTLRTLPERITNRREQDEDGATLGKNMYLLNQTFDASSNYNLNDKQSARIATYRRVKAVCTF